MRPAEITLPASIKNILILDRSKSKKSATNIIEGFLTGELPGEDRTGTQELLSALRNQLSYSARFNVITAEERLDGNSLTSAFLQQLSWEVINGLAEKYQADAVVSLEIFDTDFIVTRGRKNIKETVGDQEVEVLKYYAQGIGNITIGIRLYDVRAQTIIDQQLVTDGNTWEAYGNSIPEALIQLTSKGDATRYLSNAVGTDYAYKISPMPIRIKRAFRGGMLTLLSGSKLWKCGKADWTRPGLKSQDTWHITLPSPMKYWAISTMRYIGLKPLMSDTAIRIPAHT
jgi:hypothetical protein